MKRVIVIILVILLVAGGGAGGLMMMGIIPNPFNPTPQSGPMSGADKAAAELAAKNKFQPPSAGLDLVKLDDMIVPVILDGQVDRRVFIIARLKVNAPGNVTTVESKLRPFQSAVLSDLIPFFQKYYVSHDAVDVIVVKERLTATARKIFGEMVPEVLLINVFEQVSPRQR
ncbi:MAG: hypothetical protein AB7H70_16725 [Rhodospirillaceae bacterium]